MKIEIEELRKMILMGCKYYHVEVKRCKVLLKDEIYLYISGKYNRVPIMADIKITCKSKSKKIILLVDGEVRYGFLNLDLLRLLQQYLKLPYVTVTQNEIVITQPWIDTIKIHPNEIEISLI